MDDANPHHLSFLKRAIRASIQRSQFTSKRALLIPVAAAFVFTLTQPVVTLASSDEGTIVERALTASTAPTNSFVSAALVSPSLPDQDALLATSTYRLSYAGTALLVPGASKTIKYVAPAPAPKPAPVEQPAPAQIQLAAATPAPAPKPAAKPAPAPTPKPEPEPTPTDGRKPIGDQDQPLQWMGGQYKAGSAFPYGFCTYFVAQYGGGVRWLGDGGQWYANAQAAGNPVGQTPRKGAIFVTSESGWGHVGVVIEVKSNGNFVTKEMNYAGFGVISSRELSPNFGPLIGFIY